MERIEVEIWYFVSVWLIVIVSLTYCYFISSTIPKGKFRLISLLPVIVAFLVSPLLLSSVFLQFYFCPLIGWLANFKLLLFAFGKDDTLSINQSMPLSHFILLTSLPIKIKQTPSQNSKNTPTFDATFVTNAMIWSFLVQLYVSFKLKYVLVTQVLYSGRMLFGTQVHFALSAAIGKYFLGQELEPQFDKPHLSTSLQNFWGKRWNRMVSSLLKSTIHEPTKAFFTPWLGRRWALHPAILVTYLVSGLMHELIHFYVGRRWPTWEVTWFFIIHGVCLAVEIEVKKMAARRGWALSPKISLPLTVGFVMATGIWLCYAELIHWGADVREVEEYAALVEFVKHMVKPQWMITTYK